MRLSKDIYQFTIEEGWVYVKNRHCISLVVLLSTLLSVAQGLEYRKHYNFSTPLDKDQGALLLDHMAKVCLICKKLSN